MLLYSEGVSHYNDAKLSASRVYMLPLNLIPQIGTSREAVRLLSLTTLGFRSIQVLQIVSNDIAESGATGIDKVNRDGIPNKGFVQAVACIGNFLEIAHVSNLMGHNANSTSY